MRELLRPQLLDLERENKKLKAELQIYRGSLHREHEAIHRANDLEDNFKQIIINKQKEIKEEFETILNKHKSDIEYITLCTNQCNSMMIVLGELLEELEAITNEK